MIVNKRLQPVCRRLFRADNVLHKNAGSQKKREFVTALLSLDSTSKSIRRRSTGPHPILVPSMNSCMGLSSQSSSSNGIVQAIGNSRLQIDQEVIRQLLAKTEHQCNSSGDNLSTESEQNIQLLELMERWHEMTNSIHAPSSHRKRKRSTAIITNQAAILSQLSDDAIATLQELKTICAMNMDRLLTHYIKNFILDPKTQEEKSFFGMILSKSTKPNTRPFIIVMDAWRQISTPEAGQKTAEVLESWGNIYGGDMDNAPTRKDFDVVLETLAKCSSGDYSSYQQDSFPAEIAWDMYSILSRHADPSLLPGVVTYSHLVHTLANHAFVMRYAKKSFDTNMDSEISAIRAYFAWKQMMETIGKNKILDDDELSMIWRAHADILNLSSDSMLRRDESDLVLKVGHETEELLVRLLRMHGMEVGKNKIVAEYLYQAFSSTMVAWIKEQDIWIQRARRVRAFEQEDNQLEGILHGAKSIATLLDIMKEQGLQARPEHYHSAIQAETNCLQGGILSFDDSDKAKEVLPRVRKLLSDLEIDYLDSILKRQDDGLSVNVREKIDASIYRTVVDCFAQNLKLGGHRNDISEAAKIVERMLDLYERDLLWIGKGQKPLTICTNRVLKMMHRNRPTHHDVVLATKLFDRLSSLPLKGGENSKAYVPKPDVNTYSSYMNILSNSKSKGAVVKMVNTLDKMESEGVRFRLDHYASAIKCLVQGRNGEHKLRAKDLLFKAMQEYNDLPLEAQYKSDFNGAILYTAMITPTKSSEAISLLMTLEQQYAHTMDDHLKPDLTLYSAVLHAIAVDRKRAQWKDEKALQIYGSIDQMYRDGDPDMMPNKIFCTALLEVIVKSDFADATELGQGILDDMDELYLRTGRTEANPDFRMLLALMKIWASSKRKHKARETWSLCKDIEKRYQKYGDKSLKPSIAALNVTLNACAYTVRSNEHEEALGIVKEIQKTVGEGNIYSSVDSIFFNNTIKAYGYLLKDDRKHRDKCISSAFESCCLEGMLDKRVLQSIKHFHPHLYKKLPGFANGAVTLSDLPISWSRMCGNKNRPQTSSSHITSRATCYKSH